MNNLKRFEEAQDRDYDKAFSEIVNGRKSSHWMWYIFPQIAGLGMTDISRHYAISDIKEATDYLMDQKLSLRLTNICKELLKLESTDAHEILAARMI